MEGIEVRAFPRQVDTTTADETQRGKLKSIGAMRRVSERLSRYLRMDTETVLRRRPSIALVDELAHTNIPGSVRTKRWEDVQALLNGGIEVWTTMNVQHIESLNDRWGRRGRYF